MSALNNSLTFFQLFVGIVGVIALIMAFFLLLISTTQNIKENIWEYGCLRAMGFTKAQGMRCFLYEQYSLVLSSLALGLIVGMLLSSAVTAQFFLFLEFPFEFFFPTELTLAMMIMALLTTLFAVCIPVHKVNRR